MEYWVHRQGDTYGPYSVEVLRAWAEQKHLDSSVLLCKNGETEWKRVADLAKPLNLPISRFEQNVGKKTLFAVVMGALIFVFAWVWATQNFSSDSPNSVQEASQSESSTSASGSCESQPDDDLLKRDAASQEILEVDHQECLLAGTGATPGAEIQKLALEAARRCNTTYGCIVARSDALWDTDDEDWGEWGNAANLSWQQYVNESLELCPDQSADAALRKQCVQLYDQVAGLEIARVGTALNDGSNLELMSAARYITLARRYSDIAISMNGGNTSGLDAPDTIKAFCSGIEQFPIELPARTILGPSCIKQN